jgi:peptidoglycan/xylan/chitin deacetylase (PgdA/CDA1 family)
MRQPSPFPPYSFSAIVDRRPVRWPGDARVALWIVPNIEHFHLDLGPGAPDVRNYSRRDYGNRVGIWRLMEVLAKHQIRGTVAHNGEIAQHYPRIIEETRRLGWELMGHGLTNSSMLTGLAPDEERRVIAETRAAIEGAGTRMRGWLGPGLTETLSTVELLREAGVDYVADWVNDDLPYAMENGLVAIPYTLELNDMPLFNMPSIAAEEFYRRICETFDVLYDEGATRPRVMCIALHPFLIGVPHRIRWLDRALDYICGHDRVWRATGGEIIDAWRTQA